MSVMAAFSLTIVLSILSAAPAIAQPAGGPQAAEADGASSLGSIELIERRITVLRAERAEFGHRAQRALAARERGDLDPADANEVVLNAMTRVARTNAQITRLSAMINGGAEFGIDSAVFPVGEITEFVDSWGFSRSGGRRHKGTDILAPRGADLFAIEAGEIQRQSSSRLGGLSVYLIGDSGARYYYTHLDEIGPQEAGDRVEAGEVIGYVGDSGNARGTTHLHFQWAPDGGDGWVNPYPLLASLWTAENGSAPHVR